MKKILLLLITLLLISCNGIDNKDPILSTVLKNEIKHINRYNKIEKATKDSIVLNYIYKLKDSLKIEALEAKGVIKSKSGIMFGDLKESKQLIDNYIILCNK